MTSMTTTQLTQAGGREWQSGDRRRVYFNDLASRWPRLQVTRYGTGNVSRATLDGKQISNSRASRLLTDLDTGKLHFDVVDGQWHWQGISDTIAREIVAGIQTSLA